MFSAANSEELSSISDSNSLRLQHSVSDVSGACRHPQDMSTISVGTLWQSWCGELFYSVKPLSCEHIITQRGDIAVVAMLSDRICFCLCVMFYKPKQVARSKHTTQCVILRKEKVWLCIQGQNCRDGYHLLGSWVKSQHTWTTSTHGGNSPHRQIFIIRATNHKKHLNHHSYFIHLKSEHQSWFNTIHWIGSCSHWSPNPCSTEMLILVSENLPPICISRRTLLSLLYITCPQKQTWLLVYKH